MADVAGTASKGIKSGFNFVSGALKPVSLALVCTTAFAVFDGGLSAATLSAVNNGGAGLLTVPAEGVGEIASTISDGASWLAGTATPV